MKISGFYFFFTCVAIFFCNISSAQFGKNNMLNDEGQSIRGNATKNNNDTTKGDVTRPNRNIAINLKINAVDVDGKQHYLDTSIDNLHSRMGLAYWQQHLGNVNTAVYNLKFSPPIYATQTLGNKNYDAYNTNIDSVLFYNTTNPYTEFRYNGGSKLEQGVKILHTQNINKVNNFCFSYAKYGGPGYFELQRATRDNAYATMLYRPNAKSRYSGKYAIVFNQNKQDENGGVQDIADLNDVNYRLRSTMSVNFSGNGFRTTSSNVRNRYRQAAFKFKNYYALSFANTPNDSVEKTPNVQLFYTFNANLEKQDFKDFAPVASRYQTVYNGSFKSRDTVKALHVLNTIQNEFGIQLPNVKKINASLEAIFAIETQQYTKVGLSKTIANNYIGAALANIDTNSKWNYNARAKLYLLGQAVGNYCITASAQRQIRNIKLGLHFQQNLLDAPYLMQTYNSNFYGWNNSGLKKQFNTTIGGTMVLPALKMDFAFNNITLLNNLYYTDSMKVQQDAKPIVILQALAKKRFSFRKWNADVDAIVQQASSNTSINIPAVIANVNIGYTSYIFKRSMLANLGFQATYNSSFDTPSYLPLVNAYGYSKAFKQNNLPNIGVFFNGKVKRFRYSFQVVELQQIVNVSDIRNLNNEVGVNRILVDKYPATDWQIKVGFAWVFLN